MLKEEEESWEMLKSPQINNYVQFNENSETFHASRDSSIPIEDWLTISWIKTNRKKVEAW